MLYYQTQFGRKRTSSLEDIVKIVISLSADYYVFCERSGRRWEHYKCTLLLLFLLLLLLLKSYIIPRCDLQIEDSEPFFFPHDPLPRDNTPPYLVW